MTATNRKGGPLADLPSAVGIGTWIAVGDHPRADTLFADLERLGSRHLRLVVNAEEWRAPGSQRWYAWLLAEAARRFDVLPVVFDGEKPFAGDFIDLAGRHAAAIEVNAASPSRLAPLLLQVRRRGLYTVGGVPASAAETWLRELATHGALEPIQALTLHGSPEEAGWDGWENRVEAAAAVLRQHAAYRPIWIATGCSTLGYREQAQLQAFAEAVTAPASRIYWQEARDPTVPPLPDPRSGKRGLRDSAGKPKLLLRLLETNGLDQVRSTLSATRSPKPLNPQEPAALITGGAGFIGSNVADRLLSAGRRVVILDNLARPGTEKNLNWLRERHPDKLEFLLGDVRDPERVKEAVARVDQVYHFAAQVAVTTSLEDPFEDFEANGRGTLNLLEAIRSRSEPPSLLFTSTNKVYGGLEDVTLRAANGRYEPVDEAIRNSGIGEDRSLQFCSPYGCSKGSADQYVLDYARTFGLPATVFRMSCIYGPRQFGNEDQGWVAHFLIQALLNRPITIYGDGLQVRDVLFVDDLVDAMVTAHDQMPRLAGEPFNIGGGPANTLSLRQLLEMIEKRQHRAPRVHFEEWRASDQRYYVSDVSKFSAATGWKPRVPVSRGVNRLYDWLAAQEGMTATRNRRLAL